MLQSIAPRLETKDSELGESPAHRHVSQRQPNWKSSLKLTKMQTLLSRQRRRALILHAYSTDGFLQLAAVQDMNYQYCLV